MQKASSVLLAAAVVIGIAAFSPTPALAVDWCMICEENEDCFSCCKCGGGSTVFCGTVCGSPDSESETESIVTSEDEGEILTCTAEAPSTDEAPSPGEPAPVPSR